MPVPYHEATAATAPPPSSSPSSPSQWGPYSGAGEFSANMVIILIILFCALVLALALNAVIRYLLCSFRHRRQSRDLPSDPEKGSNQKSQISVAESLPTLIFSASTKLAGTQAECSICLAEFADGDRVRVLPACNHGFHVSCIEKWFVSRKSCPTCRASCHVEEG